MSSSPDKENRAKKNVATLSICSNAFLTAGKLIAGILSGSVSIISEAIHSGLDLLASLIAFFSVRKSSLPPDKDHAFGHGKYEDASGIIEAVLIVAAGGIIIWEAISHLLNPSALDFATLYIGMIVMGVSAALNFVVSTCLMRVAKRTHSVALESDAWHLRTDVITSAGVFLGVILIWFTGLTWIDSAVAIVLALFIIYEGVSIIRRTFRDLMDASLTKDEIAKIDEIITRHANEYTEYHGLKTRRAGPDTFVEFHLTIPYRCTLVNAHVLTDHIEDEIRSEIRRCTVIIHFEPCDARCGSEICSFLCKEEVEGGEGEKAQGDFSG
ncbi:MAG TPA: cation diffusion facilitator family transporter [Methanocorpusculum sp.]|nr:cation diffusion facilitator family transporter [Methanocorpusculum sp.]